MPKKQYKAIHRIMLKPKPAKYAEPGSLFQIEEKEGARLVKLGAAVLDDRKADTPAADETSAEDRKAQVVAAIQSLSEDQFDTKGNPKLDDLNKAMPEGEAKVKAAERDAVFAEMPDEDDEDLV